ncbi:MAG: Maf family nucleotide pyrophosphatase [Flavobacteriaceae bacterium]|nr:Maf family nucleotide pyrophosphatase [Flavobacteriaceae bacterium]
MLLESLKNKNLILASGSPRRQLFLKELGLDFKIRLKEIDEIYPSHLKEAEITDFLAQLKAQPFIEDIKKNDILITADTIVWLDNKAIGKPKDRKHAINILKNLSNKTHQVISSFCITTTNIQIVRNDTTLVKFNKLETSEIEFYVDHYKPFDKAGSYGIQEWIGYIGVEKIEGSYFNVMGFPIQKFYQEIIKL